MFGKIRRRNRFLTMNRKRFSVEQTVAIVKQAEMQLPVPELIRGVGISEQTFSRLKKQCTELEVDQVRQLKHLQDENGRLKELVVELTLDPTYRVREEHACEVVLLSRAAHPEHPGYSERPTN